jgi:K+ transporter
MSTAQGSRPVTVTIIGVLAFIAGALDMVSGVILFFLLPVQEVVDGFGGTGPLIAAAIASIVVGLITAVLAGGLLRGSQPARLIVTVLQVFSLIGSLFLAVANLGIPVGEWIGLAVSAIVLILLWTPKASAFFTR